MAVQDNTIYILIAVILNYILIYPKSKFVANILFTCLGLGIFSLTTGTGAWIGAVLFFIGLINLIYDIQGTLDTRGK